MLNRFAVLLLLVWGVVAADGWGQTRGVDNALPHLEVRGKATQLIVDGKPFLVLGGELHNSSSSSLEYMKPVWPQLVARHLNTVLVPVAWETIEPREGLFDFTVLDGLIEGARSHQLRLVVLWFGAWKNTYSSYVPPWVKRNTERFPRVQTSDGRGTERLSPFSVAVRDADAHAFAQLMRHLREVDAGRHTVLMVQVENEVGVIPESRDHARVAESAFGAEVPRVLMTFLQQHRARLDPQLRANWEASGERTTGNWQAVFGTTSLTDDLFMAWNFAAFVEHVTAAGKAEYPLPMYANAALIRPNYQPGQYNSGGPLPQSMDLWNAGAPSLNFLAPDLYFNEFVLWAGRYARPGNPLFIPETQGGAAGAANALYAFGQLAAIGFSPFGIDEEGNEPLDLAGITNPAQRPDGAAVGYAYSTLSNLADTILNAQRTGSITAALLEGEAQRFARVSVGGFTATINRATDTPAANARTGIMFIQTAPGEFLVVGSGAAQLSFSSGTLGAGTAGIESIDEEFFENGAWVPRRRLNGDENSQGQALQIHPTDLPQGRIYKVRLYRYP
jgi:beta-galactosidase GanA